jgi:hypothetical protein
MTLDVCSRAGFSLKGPGDQPLQNSFGVFGRSIRILIRLEMSFIETRVDIRAQCIYQRVPL